MNVGHTVYEMFAAFPDKTALMTDSLPGNFSVYTNLHVHLPPNFGSIKSVEDVVGRAVRERISVLGASNYYDHAIYARFARAAVEAGIVPVFGVEVLTMDEDLQAAGILTNDPKNPGKLYLCGKGLTRFDALDDTTRALWQKIREGDAQRIKMMIAKLNAINALQHRGICLQYAAIAQAVAQEKQVAPETVFLQERHLAQALQQEIFHKVPREERAPWLTRLYRTDESVDADDVVTVQNNLRSFLLKQGCAAYVDERFVSPEEAARLIAGLGGYVSYPVLADGASAVSVFEEPPQTLAERLVQRRIPAAEFIPTRNDPQTLLTYVRVLREYGLAVAAGTEHNAASRLPLLPHCKGKVPLPDELLRIFREGACVAVAHQYLQAKGEDGFRFLSEAASRHALIEEMAGLGNALIAKVARGFS